MAPLSPRRVAMLRAEVPSGCKVIGLDALGCFVIGAPRGRITIGRGMDNNLQVQGLLIGGRLNCYIEVAEDGVCTLFHAGHSLKVYVNGAPIQRRILEDGDVIEPESRGAAPLRFLFLKLEGVPGSGGG